MSREKVVSKLGTGLNADRKDGLKSSKINNYVDQITRHDPDAGHLFVVSGARAIGMYKADTLMPSIAETLTDKVRAGMGATALFSAYERASELIGRPAASYAVTWHQLQGQADQLALEERWSLIQTLNTNAELGIDSYINEADGNNDKELMRQVFGANYEIDNDQLSAYVACAIGATRLDIWKARGGLRDNEKNYIDEVNNGNYEEIYAMLAQRSSGKDGRGGPATTLEAAKVASSNGIAVRILGVNEAMTGVNITRVMVG